MRVTEKLILENQKRKNKKKSGEEWEETMTYLSRNKKENINQRGSSTWKETMSSGINVNKSSFDRLATFHTSKK